MKNYLLKWLFLFCSGAAGSYAFAPYYYLPLFVISLIILTYFIDLASSKKQSFFYGWLWGLGYYCFGLSWLLNAFGVRAATMEDGFAKDIVTYSSYSALIGLSAFLALYLGVVSLVTYKGKNKFERFFMFIIAFSLEEWIRGWLFTGFPWNPVGLIFGFDDNILQSCSYLGIYGLSLITLLLISLIYYYKGYGTLIALCLLAVLELSGYYRLKNAKVEYTDTMIRLVQPSIPQAEKWEYFSVRRNFEEYLGFTKELAATKPNLIIWGETALPFLSNDRGALKAIRAALPNDKTPLITGLIRVDEQNNYYNSLAVINKRNEHIQFYDKHHLVPFGEYVPFSKYLPIGKFVEGFGEFSSGAGVSTIYAKSENKIPSFSPLICYEAIFSGAASLKGKDRSDFLLNLTNDGWYGLGKGPYQHLANIKIRSIEEGLPLVRAANNGISAIIDPYGRIIKSLPLNYKGYLDTPLPKPLKLPPLFGLYGNAILLTIICLMITLVIARKKH